MKYKMCVHECTNRKRIFFKFSCLFFVKYLKIYNTKKYKNVFIKSSYVFFHEWNILKKILRMTNSTIQQKCKITLGEKCKRIL